MALIAIIALLINNRVAWFSFLKFILKKKKNRNRKSDLCGEQMSKYKNLTYINPIALRMAKTLWSFGRSECNMVKFPKLKQEEINTANGHF